MSAAAFRRAYGWAHLGKSLTWYFSELLFAYFLTEICGLRPLAMGVTLAASLAFSALIDVVAGKALSRRITSVRRACRLQFPGAVASGIALVAFAATSFITPDMRVVYAIGCSCLFRLAYAFYDLPQNSILALARGPEAVRIELSAIRLSYSGIAAAILAVAAAMLVGGDSAQSQIPFLLLSALLAATGAATALGLALKITRLGSNAQAELVTSAGRSPPGRQAPGANAINSSRNATSPQPHALWLLFGLVFVIAGSSGAFSRLEAYFAATALTTGVARTVVLIAIALGGAAGQPAWAWLLRTRTPRIALRAGAVMLAAGCILFLCVGRNPAAMAFAGLTYGGGLGGVNLALWSGVARVVANEPERRGVASATFAFGLLTACCKLAAAFSVLGISLLLDRIDYHSRVVASSWLLLAPMAGAPLAGALICFLAARALADDPGQSSDGTARHGGPLTQELST